MSDAGLTTERIVPPPTHPMGVARQFVNERYMEAGGRVGLRFHRGSFHRFVGDHWPEDEERRLAAELWHWLEDALFWKRARGDEVLVPFQPNKYKVGNVLEALRAIGHVNESLQPPVWLDSEGSPGVGTSGLIPVANGVLELCREHFGPIQWSCSHSTFSTSTTTRWRR